MPKQASAAAPAHIGNQIRDWIQANGFTVGHYGIVGHGCGLPTVPGVMVRPDYSPVDGGHGLYVTPTEVIQCVCLYPSNYNDWRAIARHTYQNPEELKNILTRLVHIAKGCWT